ncbi:MAG: OadG family protein [Anaerovoracaceae bacterium]
MELTLMEKFADPASEHGLTMSEMVQGGLITTVMGMGITFAVLILLWILISIMSKIFASTGKKEKKQKVAPVAAVQTQAEGISPEVVVAITAALEAAAGPNVVNNLIVKKINRVAGSAPAWNAAGRNDCVQSRNV